MEQETISDFREATFMSLNSVPSAQRVHIGIFGKRNAGKSSVINALTGQSLAIVSDVPGTTTDPVLKAMELLPLGPVVMIDTPGLDDEGELGELRIQKAYQILNKTDIALLVIDASVGVTEEDSAILERIREKKIPYIVVENKIDLTGEKEEGLAKDSGDSIRVSARTEKNIYELKERIARLAPQEDMTLKLVGNLLCPEDLIVLVVPIDLAAPKGRLILPQQQTIRDILEAGAVSVVTRETELKSTLAALGKKPRMVITDSQAFKKVSEVTPEDILLTSFSILFARYKGDLMETVQGAGKLRSLGNGDRVLISEGCTHHRQCGDIGTEKLPQWIRNFTGKDLEFVFTSGTEFPQDLSPYSLIIHCGGCMLNEREMKYRLGCARDQKIPMTNYGIAIACMNGILTRALQPFPEFQDII